MELLPSVHSRPDFAVSNYRYVAGKQPSHLPEYAVYVASREFDGVKYRTCFAYPEARVKDHD